MGEGTGWGSGAVRAVVDAAPSKMKTVAVGVSRAKTFGTSKGSTAVPVGGSAFTMASRQGGHERFNGASWTPLHVGLDGAS